MHLWRGGQIRWLLKGREGACAGECIMFELLALATSLIGVEMPVQRAGECNWEGGWEREKCTEGEGKERTSYDAVFCIAVWCMVYGVWCMLSLPRCVMPRDANSRLRAGSSPSMEIYPKKFSCGLKSFLGGKYRGKAILGVFWSHFFSFL